MRKYISLGEVVVKRQMAIGVSLIALMLVSGCAERQTTKATSERLDGLLATGIDEKALTKAGWAVKDVDLWEVNEAFAVVPMALMAELKVAHEIVNVNGGACALGHPIGASGARIMVTLMHALKARGLKKGLATLCIGGGEGTAVALEML